MDDGILSGVITAEHIQQARERNRTWRDMSDQKVRHAIEQSLGVTIEHIQQARRNNPALQYKTDQEVHDMIVRYFRHPRKEANNPGIGGSAQTPPRIAMVNAASHKLQSTAPGQRPLSIPVTVNSMLQTPSLYATRNAHPPQPAAPVSDNQANPSMSQSSRSPQKEIVMSQGLVGLHLNSILNDNLELARSMFSDKCAGLTDDHVRARLIKSFNRFCRLNIAPQRLAAMNAGDFRRQEIDISVPPDDIIVFLGHLRGFYEGLIADPDCHFFNVWIDPGSPGVVHWSEAWLKGGCGWTRERQRQKEEFRPFFEGTRQLS